MFESIIKFKTNNVIIEDKSLYPIPTKLNIPDWFKELKYSIDNKTIKGCIPFLETLTSGYILKMPIDYHIVHNKIVENERITRFETSPTNLPPSVAVKTNINYQGKNDFHSTNQRFVSFKSLLLLSFFYKTISKLFHNFSRFYFICLI